jgi:hypothetical protein
MEIINSIFFIYFSQKQPEIDFLTVKQQNYIQQVPDLLLLCYPTNIKMSSNEREPSSATLAKHLYEHIPYLLTNVMESSTRERSTSNDKKFSTYYSMPCTPPGRGICEIQKYLTAYTLYSPTLDKCVVLYFHYNCTNSYYFKVGYSIFVGDKPSDDVLKDIRTEPPTYYDDIDKMIQMTNCFIFLSEAVEALVKEENDKLYADRSMAI